MKKIAFTILCAIVMPWQMGLSGAQAEDAPHPTEQVRPEAPPGMPAAAVEQRQADHQRMIEQMQAHHDTVITHPLTPDEIAQFNEEKRAIEIQRAQFIEDSRQRQAAPPPPAEEPAPTPPPPQKDKHEPPPPPPADHGVPPPPHKTIAPVNPTIVAPAGSLTPGLRPAPKEEPKPTEKQGQGPYLKPGGDVSGLAIKRTPVDVKPSSVPPKPSSLTSIPKKSIDIAGGTMPIKTNFDKTKDKIENGPKTQFEQKWGKK